MIKVSQADGFFVGVLVVLVFVTWKGLSGPLVFDDIQNLSPLSAEVPPNYIEFILGNQSGVLGRSVSMATFAINHWFSGGINTFDLKITNLGIHIANGMLLYCIVSLLLRSLRTPIRQRWLPSIVAGCWLLSPINTGVVFYAIQRMALLSCFFVFTGILFYILWRRGYIASKSGRVVCLIFCTLSWPLACLAKENGLLLPVLILIIELYYFSSDRLFRILRLVLPSLLICGAGVIYVLYAYDFLDYSNRDFTLTDRLSTQPVVVGHYIRELLLPASTDIGIFNDDFPIQRTPWNLVTLSYGVAIVLLLAVCIRPGAQPCFRASQAGIVFYFVAHSIESTAIPLEIYFEHRNYLPSAGLMLAAVLAISAALDVVRKWPILKMALPLLALIWFSFLSYQKAQAWTSWPSVVANMYQYHPSSVRAGLEMAALLADSNQVTAALSVNENTASLNPKRLLNIKLQRLYIFCQAGIPVAQSEYHAITGLVYPIGLLETSTAFELLLEIRQRAGCSNLDFNLVAARIADMVDASVRDGLLNAEQAWNVEYYLIEYARTIGQLDFATRRVQDSIKRGNAKAAYYLNDVLR